MWLNPSVNSLECFSGYTIDALQPGTVNIIDMANTVTVQLNNTDNELSTITQEQLLSNDNNNLCIIKNDDGFEILKFRVATAVPGEPGQYILSELLRAYAGTDQMLTHTVNDTFIMLNNVIRITTNNTDQFYYLAHPSALAIEDEHINNAVLFQNTNLYEKPYAPGEPSAFWQTDDDIVLSWQDRSRFNQNNWHLYMDIDDDSDDKEWEIDVYDGDNIVRTLASTSTTKTYTSAQQTTDFGAPNLITPNGVSILSSAINPEPGTGC
jgi:hypothetical protein